jgi:hypothetical protein
MGVCVRVCVCVRLCVCLCVILGFRLTGVRIGSQSLPHCVLKKWVRSYVGCTTAPDVGFPNLICWLSRMSLV